MAGSKKKIKRHYPLPGKAAMYEEAEREWIVCWLIAKYIVYKEQKTPFQVRVYAGQHGWIGKKVGHEDMLETIWPYMAWERTIGPANLEPVKEPNAVSTGSD